MTQWESFFDQKIKLIAKKKLVLDVGGAEPFQKQLKNYENDFKKSTFITVDFNYIYGPSVTGDIHYLPIKDKSVDALICKAVLEHVYNPFIVVDEMYRVAKKGAPILVYVPFLYHYHGNREYKDYFRYTHDGLHELFKKWKNVEFQHVRGYVETTLFQFPKPIQKLAVLGRFIDEKFKLNRQTSGYYLYAEK